MSKFVATRMKWSVKWIGKERALRVASPGRPAGEPEAIRFHAPPARKRKKGKRWTSSPGRWVEMDRALHITYLFPSSSTGEGAEPKGAGWGQPSHLQLKPFELLSFFRSLSPVFHFSLERPGHQRFTFPSASTFLRRNKTFAAARVVRVVMRPLSNKNDRNKPRPDAVFPG